MLNKYLLGKASTGKFRYAQVECDEEWHEPEHGYIIQRSYGQVRGKNTLSPAIIVNKKPGSKTWKEQYTLKFNSECKKFLDKGYVEVEKHPNEYSEEELNELFGEVVTNQYGVIKPMLAKQADKVTNQKIFDKTWLASRKINGTRCLIYYKDGKVHTSSRGGGDFDYSTEHLRKHPLMIELFQKNPTLILDSELYKHGKLLNEISSAARLEKTAYDCNWLEGYVYDLIKLDELDLPAEKRIKYLRLLGQSLNLGFDPYKEWRDGELQLQIVPHVEVSGWENMMLLHNQYVSEGFEGLVIRDPSKPYKPNGRTNDMIKIKVYKDSEYPIVGLAEGKREEDMCFILETPNGQRFNCKPMGDRAQKQWYRDHINELIGKMLTIKYFEMSGVEGSEVPQQPIGICVRDYE